MEHEIILFYSWVTCIPLHLQSWPCRTEIFHAQSFKKRAMVHSYPYPEAFWNYVILKKDALHLHQRRREKYSSRG